MFETGREHDGWVVDTQLGVGGMGAVYRCHKAALPEVVAAIKVILHTDADARARFRREAVALSKLAHENVVRFRDVQVQDEPWYLVMDLAEGRPLEALTDRPLPVERVAHLGAQLASAVSYVHAKGLRHRDIKPANVIVDADDHLVLVDFGIAVREEDPRITTRGHYGSPSYAPPEWRTRGVDEEAWDVYSLGQVLFEMCTGTKAFPDDSIDEVLQAKRQLSSLDPGPDFPDALRDVVRAATALDPKLRPRAETLVALLRSLSTSGVAPPALVRDPPTILVPEPVEPAPDPAPSLAEPKRFGRVAGVLLALLIVVAACFGIG